MSYMYRYDNVNDTLNRKVLAQPHQLGSGKQFSKMWAEQGRAAYCVLSIQILVNYTIISIQYPKKLP